MCSKGKVNLPDSYHFILQDVFNESTALVGNC